MKRFLVLGLATVLLSMSFSSFASEVSEHNSATSNTALIVQASKTLGRCKIPIPVKGREWSYQEKWTWERICLGQIANLQYVSRNVNAFEDDEIECYPADLKQNSGRLPDHRRLSGEFLRTVLTDTSLLKAMEKPEVSIRCAEFFSPIDLRHANVTIGLTIMDSSFRRNVSLLGAEFERSVEFGGSCFHDFIDARGVSIRGGFFLRDGACIRSIQLIGARIVGNFEADGSDFLSGINAETLEVTGDVFLRKGAVFSTIDFAGASIGGQLQLAAGVFLEGVNLSGSTIGELVLHRRGTVDEGYQSDDPIWELNAGLNLRDAKINTLKSRLSSWQRDGEWISADLTGLQVGRLSSFRPQESGDTIAGTTGHEVVEWINGIRPDYLNQFYGPGPFEAMEHALRRDGRFSDADTVRFGMYDHRLTVEFQNGDYWALASSIVSRLFVGYGIFPHYSIYWFLGLVLIGQVRLRQTTMIDRKTQEFFALGKYDRLIFSFDNSLPIIKLTNRFESLKFQKRGPELFCIAQKIVGFVLASYFVGAITGLTG